MAHGFVHLHVHSEYSLSEGILRVEEMVAAAKEQGMPAIAITDIANVFGAVKFFRAAVAAGIQPIIGADCWLDHPSDAAHPYRVVLLCADLAGYRNLCALLSRGHGEGTATGKPALKAGWIAAHSEGLILLAGQDSDLGQALLAGDSPLAEACADRYTAAFGDRFYLALARIGRPHEEAFIHAAVTLAHARGLAVTVTHPACFRVPGDFDAHEARVCIHEGRILSDVRRPRHHTDRQYLCSPAEMMALFSDLPEAIENSVEIARRCSLRFEFGKYYLPDFPVPAGQTVETVLRAQSERGLERWLGRIPADRHAVYHERMVMELAVIAQMGFPGYFLIVADFIEWARTHDVPVGPGRGSGAGSLIAFLTGITALDPIEHGLLFERFLNPERISLPDFDVDFCIVGRDRVIEYVTEKYGKAHVAQIITHGTMAAKAVVRDVGRVLDHGYGFVDKLAKLIPQALEMTLDRALETEPLLRERYDKEEDVRAIFDTARVLEGLVRNAGKHAAGVVISPSPLVRFMPLYCEPGSRQFVTQFDMQDVEAIGLVKFDFLGLRNLTVIEHAVRLVNVQRRVSGEALLDITALPMDDGPSFALLKKCSTTALFQLESRGMKDLILRLQPDSFEEITALVALFRPGPLQSGMVDDFINRKHGREAIRYPHPSLEPILKPTYGVILYQEQVMQIARVLSGYTLGGADLLRRAMGKKKPEEMAQQRDVFVSGAEKGGVNRKLAADIFDLIEKFAGYGFNRSHSAAYALIAYQTAWLKAHYPAPFMAAVLSGDMDKTDKVVTFLAECRDMGLAILPPDLNRCEYQFAPLDDKTILYGLGAIKGLGEAAMGALLDVRSRGGPFRDLFDLCRRVDAQKVNKRVLESLIRAGALDALAPHRAVLWATLPVAMVAAERANRDTAAGQPDLFGTTSVSSPATGGVDAPEWSEEERLRGEKETLGLYLTGHPIRRFKRELQHITAFTLSALKPIENRTMVVAGLIVGLRSLNTRRGDSMAFVTLDDETARLELAVFSDLYAEERNKLVKDALLVVEGQVSVDEYSGGFRMSADRLYTMDEARAAFARCLEIRVEAEAAGPGFVPALQAILGPAVRGDCPVRLCYSGAKAEAALWLGDRWRVKPDGVLLDKLRVLTGEDRTNIIYPSTHHSPPAQLPGARPSTGT